LSQGLSDDADVQAGECSACGGIVAGSAALRGTATQREQAHVAALAAWINGEPDRASAIWQQILASHPRDALALRLAHFTDFWLGRPDRMLTAVRIALPLCEAVLAHGQGQPARAVALVRPVLGEMYRLGGSHAQQDVLEQLYLHAAVRAGLDGDARLLLERVAGRHTMPPHRRIGYRAAAPKRLGF
jgi:hypothetical protein